MAKIEIVLTEVESRLVRASTVAYRRALKDAEESHGADLLAVLSAHGRKAPGVPTRLETADDGSTRLVWNEPEPPKPLPPPP